MGCKWSSLNAPGVKIHLSHPFLELCEFHFSYNFTSCQTMKPHNDSMYNNVGIFTNFKPHAIVTNLQRLNSWSRSIGFCYSLLMFLDTTHFPPRVLPLEELPDRLLRPLPAPAAADLQARLDGAAPERPQLEAAAHLAPLLHPQRILSQKRRSHINE